MDVADVVGASPLYLDPLWRVPVELSQLERALLRCWPLRRLAFVAHAGAAASVSTQTYSRLEHSLGLLALVSHFAPADATTRAAALLHDIGHLPYSHTIEGVAGLDHHVLGEQGILALTGVLGQHGVDAEAVIATLDGRRPSVLSARAAVLTLDHLDSFVRSGRAHARTQQPPSTTLDRLTLRDGGCVCADAATCDYLAALIAAEARWQCSPLNVVSTAVIRHLATILLEDSSPTRRNEIAVMTDDELWALMASDRATADLAHALRRDPLGWRLTPGGAGDREGIHHTIARLYLDLPLIGGAPMPPQHPALAGLPRPPASFTIHAPASIGA